MVERHRQQNTPHSDSTDPFEKEVLDHYETNREKHKDERDNIQKKTFTKWVNKHLTKAGRKVEDLFVDLRDGHSLIALLEALTAERIQKENGYTRFHRIQNVQYCLDFLKKKNIKLVNIRPEDIVEGNGKLTLGLIWTIILNFQVSVIRQRLLLEAQQERAAVRSSGVASSQVSDVLLGSDHTSARDALLQWAQKVTAGYPRVNVTNFSSSWRDGLAFNAILHRYRPNLIDWNKVSDASVSNRERLDNAFAAAEKEFGVSRLLDAEDVDTDHPDEKSIITYVSSLYNALPHLPELSRLQQLQEEYIEEAQEWREWVERATRLVDDRLLSGSASELIYELQRFRDDDLPPRDEQRRRLSKVYEHLERTLFSTEFYAIPRVLTAPELQRAWNELLNSIDRRFEVLENHRTTEGNLNDLISRLERGIGITNEKLDLILKRIEDVEARVDTSPPGAVEKTVTEIVEDLNLLDNPIAGFFEDIEELKTHNHPEANDFYRRVYGLHQRRTAYLDRLTNQILVRLGVRTDTLKKENQSRLEGIRHSTFSRVEECIEWVRIRMDKLTSMEFLEDLETLEQIFEQHKHDNREIQDFRQNVDECIARQAQVSAEDTYEYCELLRVLESEYQQLRDLSAGRMLDLDSLIAFVRAAQLELIWVNEREEVEVTRNWSDIKQLDLPMLFNYYKQLLHEMELREKQYNDVHNQGAALLNQGHPAIHVIEAYLRTMQNQWDWLLALSKCLEEHLRDAHNLKSFMEEAADAEAWMEDQASRLENNYNRTDFSLEEGERFLRELDEIKEILNKYHGVLMALTERCATISPLWQRGERIQHPMTVTALCDYADKNITIKAGDDVVLLDNSDLIRWTVRDLSGVEGQVPSVVFRIPPPDAKLTAFLNRLLQQFEKLKKLWDKKHRMVRFNMVLNTMRTIQGWDLDTFNSIDPDQRDAIMRALNDDANKLLAELDPNDPLALRLREELRKTNEHFWNLLNASQKPPEPDWASQYDQKMAELLRKLEEAWRKLNENVGKPVSRTSDDLERVIVQHKSFEDALQALDGDVANVKELFRQLPNPTPTQRVNNDRLSGLWDDLWDLSRMYVERIKVLESVLNGMVEVADIVKAHEITLNSFDDLPAALDKLRGHHSQLLEINMVLKQQQTVIDQLNKNVALLRQHVARTRINEGHHPDVDAIEEEVQKLNVRWENVNAQIAERLVAAERALQIQMVYRSEYETEMAWLDSVEETINRLRKPEELRPEQYQQQLDLLVAEYSQLQEHTQAIENVNKEGGRFIREAKSFDAKMGQYSDAIVGIHGPDVKLQFRRTKPQPKNGAQIVTEELELLNRRFAQLSSLILERRNTMQVLIQNWKRQKQENVIREATFREMEISDMMSDLGRFREDIFTSHLTFQLSPSSTDAAAKNVEKVKDSLDAWRDRVKERLDAVDELCREGADTMTPEQFAVLREKRRQLAEEYDGVVRTVEGVYGRLNILAALLIEFSSVTSSMQSWMTDRTRLGGDIRHKSADPIKLEEARIEAKSLLEEVQREESRLKQIGASVIRIEKEIESLYEEMPSSSTSLPRGINADEVQMTKSRVEHDYAELLRQCQELVQFQNRVKTINDEHAQNARRAEEWILSLKKDVDETRRADLSDDDKLRRIEDLNRMAAGGSSHLDDADNSSRRLVAALEGTKAADDVRSRHERVAEERRARHQNVLDELQQEMNEAASRKAEAEGVKQAVEGMSRWSEEMAQKTKGHTELPLEEAALNEAKREEAVTRGEIEARLPLVDELLAKAYDVDDNVSREKLETAKQRLQRSLSDLKGVRDNIYDALNGLYTANSCGEKLSTAVDLTTGRVRAVQVRDAARMEEVERDVRDLNDQLANLDAATKSVCDIPNVTNTQPLTDRLRDMRRRVASCGDELEAKKGKQSEVEKLDSAFDDARQRTNSWLSRFDEDLKSLTPVSIEHAKLVEQRKELAAMADRHSHAQSQIDELEALAQNLASADDHGTAVRGASALRQAADASSRAASQSAELRTRSDRINKNDEKAAALDLAEQDVESWMETRKNALDALPIPTTKEGVKSQMAELDRMDKAGRGEQRRLEEVRLSARELAREASIEAESEGVLARERALSLNWEQLADLFDAARDRTRNAEKLLDECQQVDKWLRAKQKMVDAIGAPSTEPAVARAQSGQIHLMKAETESEKQTLDGVNALANELVGSSSGQNDDSVKDLVSKMDALNRRWHSLESGLNEKAENVEKAAQLGDELRVLQRQLRTEIGELESNVEKAAAIPSNEVESQLATLDALKSRFGGVDSAISKLKSLLMTADELEVEPSDRAAIEEQLEATKKKADEIERKIDNVKKAALSTRNEGVEMERRIDELLGVATVADNELAQAAPICADTTKLKEQLKTAEDLYGRLVEREGDFSLLKAKVADELKSKPNASTKAKLDELNSKWPKVVVGARDRKALVDRTADLVKQFDDAEVALGERLAEDEKEIDSIVSGDDDATTSSADVYDALKLVEMTMARRLADVDALNGVMGRIESSAPGPDANRLRRKADNLGDECKRISKRARTAAANAQRKSDAVAKFDRLTNETKHVVNSQKEKMGDDKKGEGQNKERVQSKLNEVEDFWALKNRELKAAGDEVKKEGTTEEGENVDRIIDELQNAVDDVLDTLRDQMAKLREKKEAAERVAADTKMTAQKMNSLHSEIIDLDTVGRARDELRRQKSEVDRLNGQLDGVDGNALELLAEWDAALEAGVVGLPAWETNKATVDEINKLAARARKRLAQREKKIEQTEQEIDKLHKDSDDIVAALRDVLASDVLAAGQNKQTADPRALAEKLKQLKDTLKPVGEQVEGFTSECKLLIKTAGPEADTSELDDLVSRVGGAWNDVTGRVADKEMGVDQAVQQLGRFEDAHRALVNWLEETEEMLENQKAPAADAKVAKAQLHAYDVLMKHVEDKQASVDGFSSMIAKMTENGSMSAEEKKNLQDKDDGVRKRYDDLLTSAQDRQRRLLDAVDLAERLNEVQTPLDAWMTSAEKRLAALAKVPTTVEKANEMLEDQMKLEQELEGKSEDVTAVLKIAPALASLVSVEDANGVSAQMQRTEQRARALDNGISNMKPLLEDFMAQISDFTLDTDDMVHWMNETEQRLCELDDLPIAPDDLIEQSNILADVAVSIADKDETMTNIFDVGRQLAVQGNPHDAILVQKQIDDLKFRYADLMTSADEKIAILAKAIPLSERFHDGFEGVMEWLDAVENDLEHIDEEDADTQAEFIFTLEEDVAKWRPEVDELTAVSTQLQALCSPDKADELLQNTVEMKRLVNGVADRVSRRAERIDMREKQSRAVLDDLCYLVEWFADARERVVAAGAPSVDPEYLRTQLKNQRLMNEDVNANKVQLRNVTSEARKVARQLGAEGTDANVELVEKCEQGKELVDEVSSVCVERTELLERALVLAEQLAHAFDELNGWLDQMDGELQSASPVTTATPPYELRAMHDHNTELSQQLAAYRPIVDRFRGDVAALQDICGEHDAVLLGEVAQEVINRYEEVRNAVRGRGQAIDNTMEATVGFGERLETLVANLQGAAHRLKENEGVSADPSILESRLAENRAIVESLRDKEHAYDALKQAAGELLANVPHGDVAAGEVANKLSRLEALWAEIENEANERGGLLETVLDKAKTFWNELDACQKAVDELRMRLEMVEPATGQPEQLAAQQDAIHAVAHEISTTGPRIEALSEAGRQLATYIPDEEKAVVEAQVDGVRSGFATITALFAEKKRDLISAMEEAMSFHGDLRALLQWLEGAERRLLEMPPVESAKQMSEISRLLDDLHVFKDDVDEHGVAKERVAATAAQLAADAPAHLAAAVRQPVAELNGRWTRIYAALAEREHKLESALLHMGKLSEAIAQLSAWCDKTRSTLVDLSPTSPTGRRVSSLRDVDIALCKLAVISNDVHAHEQSVVTVNQAAVRFAKSGGGGVDVETTNKLNEMNAKWEEIGRMLKQLAVDMNTAKNEAENVGGEVERWQAWLEETEAQLLSTKPTGGLPETAEAQLDELRVLRADVEQNTPQLESHLSNTEGYLKEQGEKADDNSWLARSHAGLKTKWTKVKELLVDREKKLQLAYEQAVALEQALNETEMWIIESERKMADLPPISRLPNVVDKQLTDHTTWADEVGGRKTAMATHQASGMRMQYYCEKKDAIPIKNRLVSLKHRIEKIASRTTERGKQLAAARDEVATWQDGVQDINLFVEDTTKRLEADGSSVTSSLDKLKQRFEEVKEAQRDVTAKQPLFEATRKRGVVLAEHSTRSEYKTIAQANEQLTRRWNDLTKKMRDRLREAEQAVLEGGAFEEAMTELETWVDEELQRYANDDNERVHGDIDAVRAVKEEEARRANERKTKENGVKTVVKKADALLASGVDESDSIREACDRLTGKWAAVEDAARKRADSIKNAENEASEFDAKTHALLDWLAVEEQKLRTPAANTKTALSQVEEVKTDLAEAKEKYEECVAKGSNLLRKCQPRAEQTLRSWIRVVDARWKEVNEKVEEREFALLEEEQKEKERDEKIARLLAFTAAKRDDLSRMTDAPPAQDLDTMDQMMKDFEQLDFELREKQPEVDATCKGIKKGVRNPGAEQLSSEWKQLWLDAMGVQGAFESQKALLEETKRLEGWKWEDWKERYVEWNDHAKARVSDLFRRIDRLHTGNVPRQVFIDGIIGSKFPTSRLEMAKVADLFDKGDGMINSKEFINALRFDRSNKPEKPQTETEKISLEIDRQKKTCSCCQPYQIEKISDNHYRFGDTHIKRMVRILRSTVMVRVGGGWESLDEFLHKHDPCRAKGRLNINMFSESKPTHALDSMRAFTKNRHAKVPGGDVPSAGTPGPIMKIREKTERSVPMFGGAGGTSAYTPTRIPRAPSEHSVAGRMSHVGSASNSRSSLFDSTANANSRPSSRASSEAGDKQSRIPSLRGKKGTRYNPPGTSK